MLIDGISLVDSSVIANTHVESGTAFPTTPKLGRMFYLNAAFAGNEPGLYVYNGTAWITGDITKVSVGSGLTGGGQAGDISIGIDTSVVATKTYADSVAAVVQADVDSLTKADIGLDLVENKSSATIRSELSSSNVTTALGFTPYNATNPSAYINLTQARQGIGAGTGISYDSTTGFVSLNATTSNVAEGTNQYFTTARAAAAAPVQSVNGKTGTFSLTATDVSALPIAGGTLTGLLVLSADPSAALGAATKQYVDAKAAAAVTPAAGQNNQIQFNNNGAFGGSSNFTWNDTTKILSMGFSSVSSAIQGGTAATITLAGGDSSSTTAGGHVNIRGGQAGNSGVCGNVTIQGGVTTGGGTNGYVSFSTGGSERLRITALGGISLGTGGTNFGTTGQALVSQGNAPAIWQTVGDFMASGSVAMTGALKLTTGTVGAPAINFGTAATGLYGSATAVSISTAGAVRATFDSTGVAFTGGITATTVAGTISTAAQPNITSVGTLTGLMLAADPTAALGAATKQYVDQVASQAATSTTANATIDGGSF